MKLAIVEDKDQVLCLTVDGTITQQDVAPVGDPLLQLLGPDGYRRSVVFDLGKVTYLDSMGVGWLLGCHRRFREQGGRLILHSLQPLALNVIRVLKLDTVLRLVADAPAALSIARGETP